MSRAVFQPVGQKRLTNVAVVRYKKGGIRFEVACYKNKVVNWRNGLETDLDEVLQSTAVFTNVSKGILAKDKELAAVFGTTDQEKICLLILEKGEFQVSDKERKLEYSNLFKDVATVLVNQCINTETGKPYTITMLERALKDVHFAVDPKRGAKQQAFEALAVLQDKIPIKRASMRLLLHAAMASEEAVMVMLAGEGAKVQSVERGGGSSGAASLGLGADCVSVDCLVEPGSFRRVTTFVRDVLGGRGAVELLATTMKETALAAEEAPVSEGMGQMRLGGDDQPAKHSSSNASSAGMVARPVARAETRAMEGSTGAADVVYPRGSIGAIPEEYASRRERFEELDRLQAGWEVEMRLRGGEGGTVDASFYDPDGKFHKSYADARRAALQFSRR